MRRLHEKIKQVRVIQPVAVGTTGTGLTGKIIDRKDYNGVEFIINYGDITASAAGITITVLEGDVTGTMTSVADADLLGTEVLAGVATQSGTARTTTAGTKKMSKRIGYNGSKRYVTVKEVPVVTAASLISVTAILHTPKVAPVSNP